jgi:hypothetical protein
MIFLNSCFERVSGFAMLLFGTEAEIDVSVARGWNVELLHLW